MARDYTRDIIRQMTKLELNSCCVFAYEKSLIYMAREEEEIMWASLIERDYEKVYYNVVIFLQDDYGKEFNTYLTERKFTLIRAKNNWRNRFKARNFYRGKLPEYKP